MHCLVLLALILYPVATEGVILFRDQAKAAGVDDAGEGNGAAFGDYDGDGWSGSGGGPPRRRRAGLALPKSG